MRTWYFRIWPLITWWARFDICIVTFSTIHLVLYLYVSIWLKVQLCFKVQAHQSPIFSSAAQQCFFTLRIPAQVGAFLKDVDNTFGMVQDVLHLGHHLRRPARALQPRWRPKPIRLRFSFGLQEQSALKRTPRLHTELDLDVLYMDGNIISRRFQWHLFQAQIHPESTEIVRESWRPVSIPALRRRLSIFGSCIVLELIRGASGGSCTTLGSLLAAATPLLGGLRKCQLVLVLLEVR